MAVLIENEDVIRKLCPDPSLIIEEDRNENGYTAMGVAVKEKKLKSIGVLYSLGAKFSDCVVGGNKKSYTVSQWFFCQSTKEKPDEYGHEVSDDEDDNVSGPVREKCLKLVVEEYARTLKKNKDGDYENKNYKDHPQSQLYYPKE